MKDNKIRKCPGCRKEVKVAWRQIYGVKTYKTKNGMNFYHAKCPECGKEWDERKAE